MRLLVTGGRDFHGYQALKATLDKIHKETPVTLLIHGGARGADSLAGAWAAFNHVPALVFPANWTKHGKAAGPLRNQQMLDQGHPDAYIAFPGGRGTADMVQRCQRHHIPNAQAPKNTQDIFEDLEAYFRRQIIAQ